DCDEEISRSLEGEPARCLQASRERHERMAGAPYLDGPFIAAVASLVVVLALARSFAGKERGAQAIERQTGQIADGALREDLERRGGAIGVDREAYQGAVRTVAVPEHALDDGVDGACRDRDALHTLEAFGETSECAVRAKAQDHITLVILMFLAA